MPFQRKRSRKTAATAAAATASLYLATSSAPALAFQLQAGFSFRSRGSSRQHHARRGPLPGSAASGFQKSSDRRRFSMFHHINTADPDEEKMSGDVDRREIHGEGSYKSRAGVSRCAGPGEGKVGPGKDVAALVLSALLLGSPNLAAEAAAPATTTSKLSTPSQDRLLSELEEKLLKLPAAGPTQEEQVIQEALAPGPSSPSAESTLTAPSSPSAGPQRTEAIWGGGGSGGSGGGDLSSAPLAAPSDLVVPSEPASATSAPPSEVPSRAEPRSPVKSRDVGGGEPMVKIKEYTFSVKLPEVRLPPVAPITVPAEGGLFSAPSSERVGAVSNLPPPATAVRDALVSAGTGDMVDNVVNAFKSVVPKQADYQRAVAELEERVHKSVESVDNPLFAPDVPLDPGFTRMFSQAKETAFAKIRPYLAPGVEPELALFMLATLPVVTVALRTAGDKSERPSPLQRSEQEARKRIVSYPNSPAKADQRLMAELRAARSGGREGAETALPVAAAGLTTEIAPAVAGASEAGAGAAVKLDLASEVAAAVGADSEDKLRAELKRLQEELASATKLTSKVEALERANARLMQQVTDLSRQPSPEEIERMAKQEAERTRLTREREERQAAQVRSIQEKEAKLTVAREILTESFPSSLGGVFVEQDSDEADSSDPGRSGADSSVALDEPATKSAAPSPEAVDETEVTKRPARRRIKKVSTSTEAGKATSKPVRAARGKTESLGVSSALNGMPEGGREDAAEIPALGATKVKEAEPIAAAPSADEFENLSEDLSRALRGVQGFDLDALDLEMDDLRPEDLEELRNLEREMGDLDMASLEAEFDQEDDETISHALRMAAESAMAHTSGGGRRIRTASPVGATSSRKPSSSGSDGASGIGNAAVLDAPRKERKQGRRSSSPASVSGAATDELVARREPFGGLGGDEQATAAAAAAAAVVTAGGVWEDEWRSMSASDVKRKTVAKLKEYLDEEGVSYPSRAKKADLVALVCDAIAA